MKKKNLLVTAIMGTAIGMFFFFGCKKDVQNAPQGQQDVTTEATGGHASARVSNTNGTNSSIPAYYDSTIFTIHFVEFSHAAEAILIAHNSGLNFIYQSDNGLPNNQPFISVIDAIPGDGMNPIWQEVQIVFNPGFIQRQLYSDTEVLAAAMGTNPEITLTKTTEVYQCPIVGHK
jgi:hypothetical protein